MSLSSLRRRISIKRILAFRRDRKGSVAVEFAFIAIPFFMIMFAIIETSVIFFANQALETATQDSARLIMTGQAQTQNMTAAQFKSQICARLATFFDCTNGVYVDVKSYSSFASVAITTPIDSSKNFVNNFAYSPGNAGDIVVVRTFYQWPLAVTGLGYDISNINGGKRLLAATAAFRNEPW